MVYLNRHVAVNLQIGSNYRIKPENGQLACLSVFFCFFFLGGGSGGEGWAC